MMRGSRARLGLLALSVLACFGLAIQVPASASSPDVGHWSRPVKVDTVSLDQVSCASATFCVAVDRNGKYVTYDGVAWSSPQSVAPKVALSEVSCPTSTFCMG